MRVVQVKNSLVTLLKACILFIAFQILLAISLLVGHLIGGSEPLLSTLDLDIWDFPSHKILAWTGLFLMLIGLPVAGLIGRFATRVRRRHFYFIEESWLKIIYGFSAGLAFPVILVLILFLAGQAEIVSYPSRLVPQQLVASMLGYGLIMILTGYYEELIFRGILACEWSRNWKSWFRGVTVSGLIFGAAHMPNVPGSFIEKSTIIVSGLVSSWFLAGIMLHFQSINAAIGLHAGWNFGLGCILGCRVSGEQLDMTLFVTEITGPSFVSGGRFGIEASALVNILVIIFAVILWKRINTQQ